ncbi:hypothetical protein WJX73_001232 [Symbiochloris irregularis]|uniref:Histone deacetylase complex subunit SAP30 Sin3 binding domain-containing protein n=1 Tax=Symbiochloris irregularis TaxID=706552 RepID=A0AAW1NIP7_9CHLO
MAASTFLNGQVAVPSGATEPQPLILPAPDVSVSEDDSHEEEEEVALLARHTRVNIIGNNRTKQSLVGKSGVVKKAVGLGGWHWLILETGEEVRLQRNALSVTAHPTGLESDFSDVEDTAPTAQTQEALPKVRTRRPPRPLAHSPELQNHRRLSVRNGPSVQSRVNFHKLDSAALKKYRRFYKLNNVGPNSSKDQLVNAVALHFMSQTVDEYKVIQRFIESASRIAASAHLHESS